MMELDLQFFAKEVELLFHQFAQHLVGIYVKWGSATKQPECGNHSYEPEAVVAVQVRYEYVVYEREMYVIPAQLQLCAFAAVNHKLLIANLYDL